MQPLLIHHHLPKAAGSSVGRVLRANLRPSEFYTDYSRQVLGEEYPREEGLEEQPLRDSLLQYWRDWYRSLTKVQRANIRCVGSHTAQCLIPAVDDRPVHPFTVLRDPVGRVVSAYRYALAMWELSRRRGVTEPLGGRQLLARTLIERGWTLADIYREVGSDHGTPLVRQIFSQFFNGQAKEILYPYLDASELPITTDAAELEQYRRRTIDVLSSYVVGTQDRLSQSIRLFADSFGWRKVFVPRVNAGSGRDAYEQVDDETRSLIRAYNSVDADLHARYSASLEGRPETGRIRNVHGKAYVRVRRMRRTASLAAGVLPSRRSRRS